MIAVRKLADLHLSAASGLVRDGRLVYVVADDEHVLDAYRADDGRRVGRVPLDLGPALPADARERKRRKADLECLALLPDRRVLALGSGSSARRRTAVLLEAAAPAGGLPGAPRTIDLSPLYAALGARFAALNIEGAAAAGPVLRLLQRGNGRAGENAVIDLDLAATLAALARGALSADLVLAIRTVDLGELDGVRLGFTDASPLDAGAPRIAFVAAAEDTEDPIDDGPCRGSALGVLGAAGDVEWLERVAGDHKLEGLTAAGTGPVLAVADADDRSRPAPLLELAITLR